LRNGSKFFDDAANALEANQEKPGTRIERLRELSRRLDTKTKRNFLIVLSYLNQTRRKRDLAAWLRAEFAGEMEGDFILITRLLVRPHVSHSNLPL
jgi:hypothetical protein